MIEASLAAIAAAGLFVTRWKANANHAAISVTPGLGAAGILLGMWYRPPLVSSAGVDSLIAFPVGVDLMLGPRLTLVVSDTGMPGACFELAWTGMVRAAVMAYGMRMLWLGGADSPDRSDQLIHSGLCE